MVFVENVRTLLQTIFDNYNKLFGKNGTFNATEEEDHDLLSLEPVRVSQPGLLHRGGGAAGTGAGNRDAGQGHIAFPRS